MWLLPQPIPAYRVSDQVETSERVVSGDTKQSSEREAVAMMMNNINQLLT